MLVKSPVAAGTTVFDFWRSGALGRGGPRGGAGGPRTFGPLSTFAGSGAGLAGGASGGAGTGARTGARAGTLARGGGGAGGITYSGFGGS
jgi:hypothetical protein